MPKEIISSKQAIAIIAVFIFGSSVIIGINSDLCQDTWIGVIVALLMAIPIVIIYARIIKLHPGKDLFDIITYLFGNFFGKIIIILIAWYAIHLGALVLRNFSEFVNITILTDTPQIIIMITMIMITFYLNIHGIESLGRWAVIIFILIIFLLPFSFILSSNFLDFTNLLPIMNHTSKEIIGASYNVFTFPFAETVLFLTIASSIKKNDNPYKIYLFGIIIGAIILLTGFLRNILILGTPMIKLKLFSSYTALRIISLGDFLSRVEGVIAINSIFGGITKISLCLFAASKGIAKIINIKNYKSILLPTSLLILSICSILYENTIQMFEFINIYAIYAIPFQIIIPILIWITAERKNRSNKLLQQKKAD